MIFSYKKLLKALPVAMMLFGGAACSSDTDSVNDPVSTDGIYLSLPLSMTRADVDNFDKLSGVDNLYISVYDKKTGDKIDDIVKDGKINTSMKGYNDHKDQNKIAVDGKYGILLSAFLPYNDYKKYLEANNDEGVYFAAFYLPGANNFGIDATVGFSAPANIADLYDATKSAYTGSLLSMPNVSDGSVWLPATEMDIPMAGVLDVTTALKSYDTTHWNRFNPMLLDHDPLILIRSMAKVVIKNGETDDSQFLTGAAFKTITKGTLIADLKNISADNTVVTKATQASVADIDVLKEVNEAKQQYVFYTFERDLSGVGIDDAARQLIELTWEGHGTKKFAFKNYKDNNVTAPEWQGVLRNHEYTFTIKKPKDGNIRVDVAVKKWEVYNYEDSY